MPLSETKMVTKCAMHQALKETDHECISKVQSVKVSKISKNNNVHGTRICRHFSKVIDKSHTQNRDLPSTLKVEWCSIL